MIIKVVPRHTHDLVQASYFDARDAAIDTGLFWFVDPPDNSRDYGQIRHTHDLHVIDVDGPPQPTAGDNEQWPVRFAYWYDSSTARDTLVVTAGTIYLMSDRGETIDRLK